MYDHSPGRPTQVSRSSAAAAIPTPGKRTLTEAIQRQVADARPAQVPAPGRAPATGPSAGAAPAIEAAAARGIGTPSSALPHHDRLAACFGRHRVDGITAHTGGAAAAAARDMGALAFATGDHVVLGDTSLRTVAHEAAHVVQQRAGIHPRTGDDDRGDPWERHADAVADAVVRGDSAAALLDEVAPPGSTAGPAAAAPVQRMKIDDHDTAETEDFASWIRMLHLQEDRAQLQNILQRLQGGTEDHEARARSRVQRALDELAGPPRERGNGEPPRLEHLPRDQWWRLFIDGNTHTGEDNVDAMRFDNEKSPGYYATMSRAFETFVAQSTGQPVDVAEYDRMHEAVTQGCLRKDEQSGPSGYAPVPHKLSGRGVSFPMTQGQYPNPIALQEMFDEGTLQLDDGLRSGMIQDALKLGDHEQQQLHLTGIQQDQHTLSPQGREGEIRLSQMLGIVYQGQNEGQSTHSSFVTLEGQRNQLMVITNLLEERVPARVNQLFQDYDSTVAKLDHLDEETKRKQQLRAIAKLVRALHVGHFYEDANGRLNTMLLLDRLLADLGMSPIILPTTDIFGGAYSVDELASAMEDGLIRFEQQLTLLASRYKDGGNDDLEDLFRDVHKESKGNNENDDLEGLFPEVPRESKEDSENDDLEGLFPEVPKERKNDGEHTDDI